MKKIISIFLLIILILSNHSIFVYALEKDDKNIKTKIENIKKNQEVKYQQYSQALGKVDNIIDDYKQKIDSKSSVYKEKNKSQIEKNLQRVKQKKFEVIGLANQRLKENLEKELKKENLNITSSDIEPNYFFELQSELISNDQYYDQQWGLHNILGNNSHNSLLFGGDKITVAVIDTGVDFSNNDLSHSKWSREICFDENNQKILGGCKKGGYDFVDNDDNPFPSDNYTHGNSVAAIIAAKTHNTVGMASIANESVEIMSLRTCCGDSNYFGAENIARAIYFAVNNDADIINASFGGPTYSKVIENALTYARNNDVLVVAAAGNYGSNNDINPLYPASYNLDNIVSVGATTQDNNLAFFSNYGSKSVDIVAPGENVYSLTGGNKIGSVNGTSFSTPFTTSLAARYLSQNRDYTYAHVIDKIYAGSYGNENLSGKIKDNLQLKIDAHSFNTSIVDPIDRPIDVIDPGEKNPEPTHPDKTPVDNSNIQLDDRYANIMKQVALFRQAQISQSSMNKHISFQELNVLEKDLQDYISAEKQYLEKRSDITSDKKSQYLKLLETQLTLIQKFNQEINNNSQIQSFSSLTQSQQTSKILEILTGLGIQPNPKKEVQILDDMSSFSFGDEDIILQEISNIKTIESKVNNSFDPGVVEGIVPQAVGVIHPADLGPTQEVVIDTTIQDLAQELGNNPVNIFNYVRNNITYEAYYGSKKSSISCLQDKLCNDIDQTNLTLALLRASGVPAKYQTSWILVSKENISKLLGVSDIKMALYALRAADIPVARVNTGQASFGQTGDYDLIDMSDDEYLSIEWTRAQALVKYDHLGGNYSNDFYLESSLTQTELENKISEQNNLEWISIDPTFVFHEVINNSQDVRTKNISERKDLLQASNINISDFFTDYVKNINNTNVSEVLKHNLINQIPELNNISGEQLENAYKTYLYSKVLQTIDFDVLPLSQGYSGVEVTRNGEIISEKLFSQLQSDQKQYLEISLKRTSDNQVVFKNKYSVDEVNNTPITLDYIGATDADRQTIIDKGSLHLTPADLVDLHVSIDTQAQALETLTTPQTVKIGESLIMTFTYSVGSQLINTSSKYALGGNSEGIYMSFGPIPQDSMDTNSKVLLAGNWAIAKRYLQRVADYNKSLETVVGSTNDVHYLRAVVTQNRVLNPIGSTATTLDFKGLSLDAHTLVKDYSLADYQLHQSRGAYMRKLFGLYASEQEGQIFDDITGLTGISTTRGLQYAYNSPDYTVYEIDSSNKAQIESLGFSENTKQSMRDYVAEGRKIITPGGMVSNQNWQGIFYIAIAQNGEGMYAIGENVVGNGGYTIDQVNKYYEDLETKEYIVDLDSSGNVFVFDEKGGNQTKCKISKSNVSNMILSTSYVYGFPCHYEEYTKLYVIESDYDEPDVEYKHIFSLYTEGAHFKSTGRKNENGEDQNYDFWRIEGINEIPDINIGTYIKKEGFFSKTIKEIYNPVKNDFFETNKYIYEKLINHSKSYKLGFPTDNLTNVQSKSSEENGTMQNFEGGRIYNYSKGEYLIYGKIFKRYNKYCVNSNGYDCSGHNSRLGFPVSDIYENNTNAYASDGTKCLNNIDYQSFESNFKDDFYKNKKVNHKIFYPYCERDITINLTTRMRKNYLNILKTGHTEALNKVGLQLRLDKKRGLQAKKYFTKESTGGQWDYKNNIYADVNTRYINEAIYNGDIKNTDKYFYIDNKIYLNDDLGNLHAGLVSEPFFSKKQILIGGACLQAEGNGEGTKSSSCSANKLELILDSLNYYSFLKLDDNKKLIIYKDDGVYPYGDDPRDTKMVELGYGIGSNILHSNILDYLK